MKIWNLLSANLVAASGIEISERKGFIRSRFRETWKSYVTNAFGADEINPLTGQAKSEVWGGWGVTLIDSLDTLWLLDMKEEFTEAVKKISKVDFFSG
ncbi:hypothetical protein DSO57_1017207 [Entomophthora muscae]|uniref:Uncharacterized protein n=1 Tax=Entomophthora muscae TaxID=34485 RepID=A0ACC2T537_9FUNG|nr:hypothetical protein DSO57_1017207 [Entomophthora muscae]